VILRIFTNCHAEILLDDSESITAAMDVVRLLLARGITAAKIVRPETRLSDDPGFKSSATQEELQ
jgi:hypothetical protein